MMLYYTISYHLILFCKFFILLYIHFINQRKFRIPTILRIAAEDLSAKKCDRADVIQQRCERRGSGE